MNLPKSVRSFFCRLLRVCQIAGRGFVGLVMLAFLLPMLAVASLFAPGPLAAQQTIIISHGDNAGMIATKLAEAQTVYASSLFRIAARLLAGSGNLKAGEYTIPPHASAADIVLMMRDGKSVMRLFTVAEGLTVAEIVDLMKEEPALMGDMPSPPPEGSLLPESYRFNYGDSRASLIARMQKSMQEKINEVWAGRDHDLLLRAPQEMVVLASIVEKETGKAEERPRIAGVFYNRLQQNMRLQSDPTVIYALTGGKHDLGRDLTHEDLFYASPINTYTSDGLPPQPICNPGLAAMQAVAHPEYHHFLYFVADGTGGHAFAADLATHNENINRWHQTLQKNPPKP